MQNLCSQSHSVALPPALYNRLGEVAVAQFETRDTIAARLIHTALQLQHAPRARRRDGGKPPAESLLRPVSASSKRGRVLRYFLHRADASVPGAMTEFNLLSRSAVFATWTVLRREHGIGYIFNATTDTITVRLPCDEANIFRVEPTGGI